MNEKTYIKKLLSHINGKKHKQIIEAELSDHIAEKEKWYEEIGYDPETAAIRAEEDMGDPDTAGEELSSLHSGTDKRSILVSALMLILPMLGYFLAFLQGSFEPPLRFELCYLLECPLVFFMLAAMIYAFRKQRIIPLLISSAVSAYTLHSENCCALLLTSGRDIGRYIFLGFSDDYGGYYLYTLLADNGVPLSLLNTVRIVLPVIVLLCAVVPAAIIIKNKRFINRKYDYYIGRGVKIFLSVFAAVFLISSTAQGVQLSAFGKRYVQSVEENLPLQNRSMIEAVYDFKKNGNSDFSDIIREFDIKDNPYCITESETENIYSESFLCTRTPQIINLFTGSDFTPFDEEAAESLIDFVRSGGKYIEDAPMYCELSYDGEDRIVLSCYTDSYGMQKLMFDYIDGRFCLTDSLICTDADAELSDEQFRQFFDAFMAERDELANHKSFITDPNYELHAFTETFSVTYNDMEDVYTVYFAFRPFSITEVDGEVYIEGERTFFGSKDSYIAKVRFSDGRAKIMKTVKGGDIGPIYFKEFLNKKDSVDYDNWERSIHGNYSELDGRRLKPFVKADSEKKFAERCGKSSKIKGEIIYNFDGSYYLDEYGS